MGRQGKLIPGKGFIRERAIKDAQEMWDLFEAYITDCRESGELPTKPGFYLHANITKYTIRDYTAKYGDEFTQVVENIDNKLQEELIQSGLRNPKANAMQIFLLKAKHGYSDKPGIVQNFMTTGPMNFHGMKESDLAKLKKKFEKNRQLEESE